MLKCRRDITSQVRRFLILGFLFAASHLYGFKRPVGCGSAVEHREPWGFIAVADPGVAESPFADALKRRGLIPIFVRSDQSRDAVHFSVLKRFHDLGEVINARLRSGDFDEVLGALREIMRREKLPLTHVVAEGASGSHFAEKLSAALQLPGHDATFLSSITIPADMAARLRKHFNRKRSEVRMMPQILAENTAQVREWLKEEFHGWHGTDGLVVSPGIRYAGSPHIFVRNNFELEAAVSHIIGSGNPMGWTNHRVLVMPYFTGEEYSVNGAVLREGKRAHIRYTSVVKHVRPDRTDSGNETLQFAYEVPQGLFAAQEEVIEGMGYGIGPFHGQFKITSDGTIYFLNYSLQFHGHGLTDLLDSCTNYGQVEAAADVYGDAERFIEQAKRPYENSHRSVVVSIEVPRSNRVLRANHAPLDQIALKLNEAGHLFRIDRYVQHNQRLEPSNGRMTVMAKIEIRVPAGQIERDAVLQSYLKWIQELEAGGRFFK